MRWVKRGAFALLVLSAVIFGALIFARMRDVE
jgi:hypothetical protein